MASSPFLQSNSLKPQNKTNCYCPDKNANVDDGDATGTAAVIDNDNESDNDTLKFHAWLLNQTYQWINHHPFKYEIQYEYQVQDENQETQALWKSLMDYHQQNQTHSNTTTTDAITDHLFTSKSQIKRSCYNGHVIILLRRKHNNCIGDGDDDEPKQKQRILGDDPFRNVHPGDTIQIQRRISCSSKDDATSTYYPVSVTKKVLPPSRFFQPLRNQTSGITDSHHESINTTILPSVIYEDDEMAIVYKPENWTTIGNNNNNNADDDNDLQSVLGFILKPPPSLLPPKSNSKSQHYHPRPVHRLDRATSGLVVIAKTKPSMQFLSRVFRQRHVIKTYSAIVRRMMTSAPTANATGDGDHELQQYDFMSKKDNNDWNIIDYPIDGKSAISEYRWMMVINQNLKHKGEDHQRHRHHHEDSSSSAAGAPSLSLIQVKPHTGRMHQIRRHVAYCLRAPIAGDQKYDFGYTRKRRKQKSSIGDENNHIGNDDDGMYLCCHKLDLPIMTRTSTSFSPTTDGCSRTRVPSPPGCCVEIIQQDKDSDNEQKGGEEYFRRLRVSVPLPLKFQKKLRT